MERQILQFSYKGYSTSRLFCQYCSMYVRTGRWWQICILYRRIQAFESNCYRRMLGMSYREHKTKRIWMAINHQMQELLTSTIKRRKLWSFSHVCHHDMLQKIMQETVDGSHRRGRPHKSWKDTIKEWTGQSMLSLVHIMDDRSVGSHRRRCICQGYPNDAWASLELVNWLDIFKRNAQAFSLNAIVDVCHRRRHEMILLNISESIRASDFEKFTTRLPAIVFTFRPEMTS